MADAHVAQGSVERVVDKLGGGLTKSSMGIRMMGLPSISQHISRLVISSKSFRNIGVAKNKPRESYEF
jgi:hypothetical protein